MAALKSGSPHEEDTYIGPIIAVKEAERIEAWVKEALDKGALVPENQDPVAQHSIWRFTSEVKDATQRWRTCSQLWTFINSKHLSQSRPLRPHAAEVDLVSDAACYFTNKIGDASALWVRNKRKLGRLAVSHMLTLDRGTRNRRHAAGGREARRRHA